MIVDCHTRIWRSADQLGRSTAGWTRSQIASTGTSRAIPDAAPENHLAACQPVDKTIVLGFCSSYLDAKVPNDFLADYVRAHGDRLIGFAGIDPGEPVTAVEEVQRAHGALGLKGIVVSPSAQGFHPASTGALRVFEQAVRLHMPVVFGQGVLPMAEAKMEYGHPHLLDEVARELPDLKIIVAHMGFPWVQECIALLGKQPNVYADVSRLVRRPWCAYNALLLAHEYGVMDRLLFGSDFPFASATTAIESLYSLNQISHGTSLPMIPRERLRAIVESNALDLLGIKAPLTPPEDTGPGSVLDDDI